MLIDLTLLTMRALTSDGRALHARRRGRPGRPAAISSTLDAGADFENEQDPLPPPPQPGED